MTYWLWIALRIYAAANAVAIIGITIHGAIRMRKEQEHDEVSEVREREN